MVIRAGALDHKTPLPDLGNMNREILLVINFVTEHFVPQHHEHLLVMNFVPEHFEAELRENLSVMNFVPEHLQDSTYLYSSGCSENPRISFIFCSSLEQRSLSETAHANNE